MKNLCAILILFLASNIVIGQCVPDPNAPDTCIICPTPEQGLNPAYIGVEYEQVFTFNVPDEVEVQGNLFPLYWVRLDSIRYLPEGLYYECVPNDCLFLALTQGCVVVKGIPTENNAEGSYNLVLDACFESINNLVLCDSVPGDLLDSQYTIDLFSTVATNNLQQEGFELQNTPNPFSGFTQVEIQAPRNTDLEFIVYDLIGNEIHQRNITVNSGINTIEFDGSQLSNGMYIYTIKDGQQKLSNKMIINN